MYFVEIKDRPSNLLGWSSFITREQRRVWKASLCVSFGRYGKLGMTFVFRDEGLSLQKVKSFFTSLLGDQIVFCGWSCYLCEFH